MVPPPTLSQNIGRLAMGSLMRVAPRLGSRLAWSQFIQSPIPLVPDNQDVHFLETHSRTEVLESAGHRVTVYRVAPVGKIRARVLMMHGWGSRATAMLGMGKQFIHSGIEVVLYDGPGSGLTGSPISILPHNWQVLEDLQRHSGPFDVVIGHSFAGIAAAHALAEGKLSSCKGLVTIGSPNSLQSLTERVLQDRGMPMSIMEYFDQRSVELTGRSMANLGIVAALAVAGASPIAYLCLHDRDDKEVPISHADEIERALPWAQVVRTEGLGHNRILKDRDQQIRVRQFAENLLGEG